MKCENAVDLIVDSLMDTLDDEEQQALSAHLQACAACRAEAEKMKALWDGLGELRVPAARPQAAFEFGRRLSTVRSRRPLAPPLQAAAAMALFVIGGAVGFMVGGSGAPPGPPSADSSTFLLLVRGEEPQGAAQGEVLVQEYRDWASSLAADGRLMGANKLTDEPGRWISGSPAGDPRTQSDVSGYFLVNASSYTEATEIAGSSPHIRYGGTFEIRQVDPVN
jgi:hypothetical protein